MKKIRNNLNIIYQRRDIQMANKYILKTTIYLAIRKMQIKTILRFHLIPGIMLLIRNKVEDNK